MLLRHKPVTPLNRGRPLSGRVRAPTQAGWREGGGAAGRTWAGRGWGPPARGRPRKVSGQSLTRPELGAPLLMPRERGPAAAWGCGRRPLSFLPVFMLLILRRQQGLLFNQRKRNLQRRGDADQAAGTAGAPPWGQQGLEAWALGVLHSADGVGGSGGSYGGPRPGASGCRGDLQVTARAP